MSRFPASLRLDFDPQEPNLEDPLALVNPSSTHSQMLPPQIVSRF